MFGTVYDVCVCVCAREEQDAHEMLNVVMTTLEEEIQARSATQTNQV